MCQTFEEFTIQLSAKVHSKISYLFISTINVFQSVKKSCTNGTKVSYMTALQESSVTMNSRASTNNFFHKETQKGSQNLFFIRSTKTRMELSNSKNSFSPSA